MRLHSWLSPKCHVAKSPLDGWGVFATDKISEGELLAVWGGVVYTASELESIGAAFTHFRTHPIEVADGFFLASTSLTAIDDAERFNHGCEPNVGVQGQLLVVARRAIRENEELVLDYETTCGSMTPFQCVWAARLAGVSSTAARRIPRISCGPTLVGYPFTFPNGWLIVIERWQFYALLLLSALGGGVGDILLAKWARLDRWGWLVAGLLSWLTSLLIFGLLMRHGGRSLGVTFTMTAVVHVGLVLGWDWATGESRVSTLEWIGVGFATVGVLLIEAGQAAE